MQAILTQEYLVYFKEKWCRTAEKGPLFGHVDGFQIDPKKAPPLGVADCDIFKKENITIPSHTVLDAPAVL